MKTIQIGINHQFDIHEPIALAVGYFDGFHLGHQALLQEAKKKAEQHNLKSAVLSFDPNPLVTLGKMKEEKYLTSLKDREKILEAMHFDYFIILDFTKEVANLLPEVFIEQFLIQMNVKEVVCGFDFFFGRFGKGNGDLLKTYSEFNTTIIEQVSNDHLKISTTRLNGLLQEGNIEKVNELMTRPYQITGDVIHGKKRGHQLGFPTANVNYHHYIVPKRGVYAVKVKVSNQTYIGMCNIGMNPTFNDIDHDSMEVHIFDFNQDVYHQEITVQFYKHIRDEKAFQSKEKLIQQLSQDKEEIQAYFA